MKDHEATKRTFVCFVIVASFVPLEVDLRAELEEARRQHRLRRQPGLRRVGDDSRRLVSRQQNCRLGLS